MTVKLAARSKNTHSSVDLSQQSDEELMSRYLKGDSSGYAALVRRYERELFSYIRRLIADPALAEDVFQNTFLTVHVKRHLFGVGRPFRPWLYALATNQAIDALRRNGRHHRTSLDQWHGGESQTTLMDMVASGDQPPGEEVERQEIADLVRKSVDELPEHLRLAIVLSYYQGMKYRDIAVALDIPVGTVKSRLHAAVLRLGENWKRLGIGQP